MKLDQIIDNMQDVLDDGGIRGMSLVFSIAVIVITVIFVVFILAVNYPSVGFPAILGLIVGRIAIAAFTGK